MIEENEVLKTISIHYDIVDHSIDLALFVEAARSIEQVTSLISKELTGTIPKIVVLPPEKGSFKQVIGIVFVGTLSFFPSDIVSGVVEGLTGKKLSEWSRSVTECVLDTTRAFFSQKYEDVRKVVGESSLFLSAIKSKSDFYTSCINSTSIKGLGFSDKESFPIQRNNFIDYVEPEKLEKEQSNVYKLQELIIVSPVIVDKSQMKWKFKILNDNKICSMSMDDKKFQNNVLLGCYPLKKTSKDDVLTAYVCYQKKSNASECSVIKVYKINDLVIENIPENLTLEKPMRDEDPRQGFLF